MTAQTVHIIGAGLAGCEAAWYLANRGVRVRLYEQKPQKKSLAHHADTFAELVCSNSLKAKRVNSAGGLLKAEMRLWSSLCLQAADTCQVPAGGALAVERTAFSAYITEKILGHPAIEMVYGEQTEIPADGAPVIVATGPLTSGALYDAIRQRCGDYLSFYDAAAPIVTAESVDAAFSFTQSRYADDEGDYVNCPLDKQEYEAFYQALVTAQAAPLHHFDRPVVYEGCMPIEIMARRGADTIRFGPMKPVGLRDPRTGKRPWAVLQLRRENAAGSLYNLVGFQTNLKFGEQKRVFSMIPALKNAEFVRYGVMHRNTFIDSPRVLSGSLQLRDGAPVWFAGQITGVEGYMESAASGIAAGVAVFRALHGLPAPKFPRETMLGALLGYISDPSVKDFQPMGANFGILPALDVKIRNKQERYMALAQRALEQMEHVKQLLDRV